MYALEEGARYNLMTWSMAPGYSNNQTSIIQHTVPQPARVGPGMPVDGGDIMPRMSRYLFHVPMDNATVTLALTPLGDWLSHPLFMVMGVDRCGYPRSFERSEWRTQLNREPFVVIRPDDYTFRRPARCDRFTPMGQAGVYYVTIWNFGDEELFTLALSVRDAFSRFTNESSIILVNELAQVGVADYPDKAYFRMFPVLPTQQIHVGMPDHAVLYHSTTVPYPNASTTTDIKDSRLDTEWLQWPLNNASHFFSIETGPEVFVLTPKVYNGTNDTNVITVMEPGVASLGRAYPTFVTHYQFFVTNTNVTAVLVNLEVISGNPHLYLNYAPFNPVGQGPSWRVSNVTFPSRTNNWYNITDPNFPVMRIPNPPMGHYVLSIVPANSSRAQADWKVTFRQQYPRLNSDPTILHDGVKASDWLYNASTNWHLIRVPRRESRDAYQEVRISLTSWYGDAEMFVTTSNDFDPEQPRWWWRSYDSGTASLVINSNERHWCDDCDLIVSVYSNEISAYYSIVATLYGNWSYIPLTNHLPINHRTPINSTQRFYYRPYNYELHHGFRIHISPSYGAAVFAIRAIQVSDYIGKPWPFPDGNMSSTAQWTSSGWFEGTWVHVSHLDPNFCTSHGGQTDVPDERSNCIYLISVSEPTGMVETQYTLLLQAVVTADMLPTDDASYDPVQEPHNRLINHIALQQFGEMDNVTYYKTLTANPGSVVYVAMTVLSGLTEMYVDYRMRYPNATSALWRSTDQKTFSFSFIVDGDSAFTELFIAVRCVSNATYTVMASQYSANRLGRFPTRLTNGVPQYDTLAAVRPNDPNARSPLLYWRYYVYYLPVQDDITFSINKIMGEVEAYIAFDPLLNLNDGNYTRFRIPTQFDNDHAMYHHSLDTFPLMAAQPGRYVIGVHAGSLADYQISVTAHFTHQVLVVTRPTAGAIQVYTYGPDDVRDAARYVFYLASTPYSNIPDDMLTISLTTYSGLAHVFVSDITWDIDPRNSSSYRWNATDHPYQINIPGSQLRQGPYWIYIHAWQNTTYSLQASTMFPPLGMQTGLPLTKGAWQDGGVSHFYYKTLAGGQNRAFVAFITVVPLVGHCYVYATNFTLFPNGAGPWHEWSGDYIYSKPQSIFIPNQQCGSDRCLYLIEVFCPVPSFYTLNLVPSPFSNHGVSSAVVIEQHVPQFHFLPPGGDDTSRSPRTYFTFHIPDDNSTAVLSFTPQWTSRPDTTVGWQNLNVVGGGGSVRLPYGGRWSGLLDIQSGLPRHRHRPQRRLLPSGQRLQPHSGRRVLRHRFQPGSLHHRVHHGADHPRQPSR